MNKQDSSPSPTLDGSDPSRKLFRRMPPPPVRMVTRGVSGAVRPKSVDEILSSLDVSYTSAHYDHIINSCFSKKILCQYLEKRVPHHHIVALINTYHAL